MQGLWTGKHIQWKFINNIDKPVLEADENEEVINLKRGSYKKI